MFSLFLVGGFLCVCWKNYLKEGDCLVVCRLVFCKDKRHFIRNAQCHDPARGWGNNLGSWLHVGVNDVAN